MIVASISLIIGALQPALAPVSVHQADPVPSVMSGTATINPTCLKEYAAPAEVPTEPIPNCNPGGWVTTADYPKAAINSGEQGPTNFTLTIDAQGRPTDCTIDGSSGSSRLDARVCPLLMRRARFIPAFSEEGKPVEGQWSNTIRWEIPNDQGPYPLPPAGELIASYIVEKDGTVSDCKVEKLEGGAPIEEEFCNARTTFEPKLVDDGSPIRTRIRIIHKVVHEPVPE